ncbi:MAG: hypothetical protein QNJ31_04535 [Candidatus Caenarcaniphilales bacterium]|nr:hypothetical protein [Candidatus Caenarcaniphilales bacterium]
MINGISSIRRTPIVFNSESQSKDKENYFEAKNKDKEVVTSSSSEKEVKEKAEEYRSRLQEHQDAIRAKLEGIPPKSN